MKFSCVGKFLLICCLFGLSNCTVDYDQTTDQQISSTTTAGNQQFNTWTNMMDANQTITYDASAYGKITGDLQTLKDRLANAPDFETKNLVSIPEDDITLWNNVQLTQLHNTANFNKHYLAIQEELFDYDMGLLTLYEQALKGGASKSSAASSVSNAKATKPGI